MLYEFIEIELILFLFCFFDKRLIVKMYRELYNDFDLNIKCVLESEENFLDILFYMFFYEMYKVSFYEIYL